MSILGRKRYVGKVLQRKLLVFYQVSNAFIIENIIENVLDQQKCISLTPHPSKMGVRIGIEAPILLIKASPN